MFKPFIIINNIVYYYCVYLTKLRIHNRIFVNYHSPFIHMWLSLEMTLFIFQFNFFITWATIVLIHLLKTISLKFSFQQHVYFVWYRNHLSHIKKYVLINEIVQEILIIIRLSVISDNIIHIPINTISMDFLIRVITITIYIISILSNIFKELSPHNWYFFKYVFITGFLSSLSRFIVILFIFLTLCISFDAIVVFYPFVLDYKKSQR